jgi:hypothetical protein
LTKQGIGAIYELILPAAPASIHLSSDPDVDKVGVPLALTQHAQVEGDFQESIRGVHEDPAGGCQGILWEKVMMRS